MVGKLTSWPLANLTKIILVHLHACATDGVFMPTGDGPPAFLPAQPMTQADLAALTEKVRRRVVRWFRMQRLLDADAAADMLRWENSGFSELSPCDFLDRLADLVPPPRKHRHRLPT